MTRFQMFPFVLNYKKQSFVNQRDAKHLKYVHPCATSLPADAIRITLCLLFSSWQLLAE